jgi:hypothetical protein
MYAKLTISIVLPISMKIYYAEIGVGADLFCTNLKMIVCVALKYAFTVILTL